MSVKFVCRVRRILLHGLLAAGLLSRCLTSIGSGRRSLVFVLTALISMAAAFPEVRISSPRAGKLVRAGILLSSAVLCFLCAQLCMDRLGYLWIIPLRFILLNVVCCLVLALGLYAVTGSARTAGISALFLILILASVNYFVVALRGSELKPADLFAWRTALNVTGSYRLVPCNAMVYAWAAGLLWALFLLDGVRLPRPSLRLRRTASIALAGILAAAAAVSVPFVERQPYLALGTLHNGFVLNFVTELRYSRAEKPEGYDAFDFAALEARYPGAEAKPERTPHVIVIMDEAFSDLRIYNGSLHTDVPVTPFYDSLTENTVRGFALASIYGGGTSNSEYEFLTGNSMHFLPSGSSAYQQFVGEDTFSVVSWFQQLGYRTVAMHPYMAVNWMRSTVWPRLGFQETLFLEDFPQEDLLRGFVTDREMFDQILALLADDGQDAPLFLFGVTMQNHGAYDYPQEVCPSTVQLQTGSQDFAEAEQYLTLLRKTDQALEAFLTGLENLDEDVAVLFYGDHQPNLPEAFLEELGAAALTLEEQQKRYTVPFFLWTNYDIPEQTVELTSLNYLSGYLFAAAGLPAPAYVQYLQDLEEQLPAVNHLGYYSVEAGRFLPHSQAQGTERAALDTYGILVYNSLYGGKNRSPVFFP